MSKKVNAPEIPLCTNIIRLQSYLLAPDEVILFDWFIVKQIAFKYIDFHYSQSRIEEETRIKRVRQDAIIKRFTEWGFLMPEVRINRVTRGKVRFFRVDFGVLAQTEVLCRVIDNNKELFKDYLRFMQYHAQIQVQDAEQEADSATNKRTVDRIYRLLNETYDERRMMYNEGDLTDQEPEYEIPSIQLPRNKSISRKILHLSTIYNDTTIQRAFVAYVDAVLVKKNTPYKILDYFLSYNDTKDGFGVVEYYINSYVRHYTVQKEEDEEEEDYY